MARKRLSQKEVAKRLIRLRNLEKLHRISKQMRNKKDELIAAQAKQIDNLEEGNLLRDKLIKAQAIRIAELEAMVFGKKKKPPIGGTPGSGKDEIVAKPKKPRNKASYHRPVPPDAAITNVVPVSLPETCACGGDFVDVTEHDRFVEDIPLPELADDYMAHLVIKYRIARGVCAKCSKVTSSQDLGGAVVSLGPNTRLLVSHLISVMGLSYAQVIQLFAGLYNLRLTDGEITNVLDKQHKAWLPAYNQLQADIRGSPINHADESPWPIQSLQGQGYGWSLSDGLSDKVCYALKNSRGAVHAKALFGEDSNQPFAGVRITDDYGPYRSERLPGQQQLCWSHLYRAIRDLRHNDNLPEEQLPYVTWWYEQFAAIYQDLGMYLDEPFDEVVRHTQADELWQRVQDLCQCTIPTTGEPEKLTRLKAQLTRAGKDRLFTCLPSNTPCDNNRAERDIRGLVIKRKRSFGSKTEKGAQALATVLSICTTTWRENPTSYFKALAAIA